MRSEPNYLAVVALQRRCGHFYLGYGRGNAAPRQNYSTTAQLLSVRKETLENLANKRRYGATHYFGYRPGTTGLIKRRGLDRAKLGRASCAPGSGHIMTCEQRGDGSFTTEQYSGQFISAAGVDIYRASEGAPLARPTWA